MLCADGDAGEDTLVGYTCETQTSFPTCDGGYAAARARATPRFSKRGEIE